MERGGLRALQAQRMINLVALRLAPALVAGLIAYSHMSSVNHALIVFVSMLGAAQLIERSRFPLHLMPATRIMLGLVAPVLGAAIAWWLGGATGGSWALGAYPAIVLGAWLVLALGAWVKARTMRGLTARVAVIGDRSFALGLAREWDAAGIRDHRLAGWIGRPDEPGHGLSWLGSLREVRRIVLERDIELLVCAPGDDLSEGEERAVFETVADFCLDLPVKMIGANQLYEEALGHVPVGTINAAWYRYIMHPNFHGSSPLSKRAFDLVVATLMSVVFFPVLLVAALAIKLEDRGPIFYRQRRLGEFGREFEMLKLRTMRDDAKCDATEWGDSEDERITRVGAFLRRHHLNEVPQLWNVLRGDMTLVGPRPELPEMVAQLESKFQHYTRRHLIKPGVAGWAALRCGYAGSDLGAAWTLCHDLFYIKRRSILADTMILAETALELFRDPHRVLRTPDERFLIGDLPEESRPSLAIVGGKSHG